jgi:hypothetical protein
MPKPCSLELRERVVEAVESRGSPPNPVHKNVPITSDIQATLPHDRNPL